MDPFLRSYHLEEAGGFGCRVHQSRNFSTPEFLERQRLRKRGDLYADSQRAKYPACGEK